MRTETIGSETTEARRIHETSVPTRETGEAAETVWELIEKQMATHPARTAIVDGEAEIDYSRLDQRSGAIAAELVARGVAPGSLVGVCMGRTWELIATLVGILRAGCAYVPLDPAYPRERIRYMRDHARLAAAIVDHEARAVLCAGVPELVSLDEVTARSADGVVGPSAEDLAYVLYTSGSTGRPKGVAIEHRSVVALTRTMRSMLSDDELSGVLASASICFDASVMEILGTLCLGGTMVLADNVLALLDLPAANRVRMCVMVPSSMQAYLAAGQLPAGLRCVVLGAEVLKRSLVDRLHALDPKRRLINVYGPTEDTVFSTTAEITLGMETITIGTSVAGSRSYILDETMQPVDVGVEGELYLAGNKLARGYLHDEGLTRERFLEIDPTGPVPETRLYKTGDRCRRRDDGAIEFLGRVDQQVKIRGMRIELGEIESALEGMRGVDAAAVAVDDRGDHPVLVGYVVSRDDTVTNEAARAHLASRLPAYMVPRIVMRLEAFPRLPNDKLDRQRLPRPDRSGAQATQLGDGGVGDPGGAAPPAASRDERRADLLSTVRGEIASILRLEDPEHVAPDHAMEELGIDSLTRVELSARLGAMVGCKLPVSALMERPTPAAVADYLLDVTGNGTEPAATGASVGAAHTLASFQAQIQACYPPFLAGKAPAWSATDRGTLVRALKQLVGRPGDPFCKLVRTGSGRHGVVADVDRDRERDAIIWTTNLYLGLNRDPEVIKEAREAVARFGTGMGTSAAASGITDLHVGFENAFAELVGKPAACLFPTGYTANLGAVAGIVGTNDVVVMDQLCHASIVDGARVSGATIRTFQHNNPADLEAVLRTEASPYRTVLVVLEGVYSMGEGAAPVEAIVRIAKQYDALVLVDEAHSFGFYGPRGAGICAERGVTDQVDFIMTTLSKALGSLGGVVAAREEHVALLKSSARAFIFQASTSPADMAAALAALRRLSTDDSLRERLWDTTRYMRARFTEAGFDLGTGDGPIVTPHFSDKEKLFAIVNGLFARGVHTSAVTYPIVEVGRGRLRFICSAAHTRDDVDRTVEALVEAAREVEERQGVAASPTTETRRSRSDLYAWAETFAQGLNERWAEVPLPLPSVAVSVGGLDQPTPITIVFDEGTATVGASPPAAVPRCSLVLTNEEVASALDSSDVQGLLDGVLQGHCVLDGQVEPFIWLIGRLAEARSTIEPAGGAHRSTGGET